MTCTSCNQSSSQINTAVDMTQIDIAQMQNMSVDQIINLYRQGYKIPENVGFKESSLAVKDIGTMQYIWFGLFSYGSYISYKSKHNIWAIILGGLALGSLGGIYSNLKK